MSNKKPKHQKNNEAEASPTPEAEQETRSILVVEDDPAVRNLIVDYLKNRNFNVSQAQDGLEGLQIAMTEKPDVILTDIVMPGMDGLEMIKHLRSHMGTMLIPIITLTAVNNLETRVSILQAGGDSIMYKPFDLQELEARIDRSVTISSNYLKLTYVDALTGIYNRRLFDERLPVEVNRSKRYSQPLALTIFDIDHFKKFNDTYGHRAGDFVLSTLAQHIKKSLRTQDVVCRYGGEEFAVIMPMTKVQDAALVMSRIRADLQDRTFYSPYDDRDFNILISVGIAQFPSDGETADSLTRSADEALYEAKETGRNRVVMYTPKISTLKEKLDTDHLK